MEAIVQGLIQSGPTGLAAAAILFIHLSSLKTLGRELRSTRKVLIGAIRSIRDRLDKIDGRLDVLESDLAHPHTLPFPRPEHPPEKPA